MKKIVVFASGGGSDFQSVIDGIESGLIKAEISLLIAGKEDIYAIERAKAHGIDWAVYRKKDYPSAEAMYDDIIARLDTINPDLIVLAGYLTILTPNIVGRYKGRIINIHPSLIPKYCGDGFYGMKVHRAVIAAGEKVSGATVHYVDEGTDTGAIIKQVTVNVAEDDTPESLQKRVLEAEHKLLPETVAALLND